MTTYNQYVPRPACQDLRSSLVYALQVSFINLEKYCANGFMALRHCTFFWTGFLATPVKQFGLVSLYHLFHDEYKIKKLKTIKFWLKTPFLREIN